MADVRPLVLVRAFAMAAAGGPRMAGLASGLLGEMRPRYSAEFEWLGAAWPEMRIFLVANRLSG